MDINNLEIESTLTLNVEDCAGYIETYCCDFLLPPPKGIYSNSRIDPVMRDGGNYYTVQINKGQIKRTQVTDLNKVKKGLSVYTEINGKDTVVVTSMQLQNKDRCLGTLPIRPYRGVKIVEQLINNQVDGFIKYRKGSKDLYSGITCHMIENITDEQLEDVVSVIKEQYSEIRKVLRDFMGKHDWNLYFVSLKSGNATIQKSIDWRAYDWMCRMESKEWS